MLSIYASVCCTHACHTLKHTLYAYALPHPNMHHTRRQFMTAIVGRVQAIVLAKKFLILPVLLSSET